MQVCASNGRIAFEEIGYTRLTIPLVAARAGATHQLFTDAFRPRSNWSMRRVFPIAERRIVLARFESGVRALILASIDLSAGRGATPRYQAHGRNASEPGYRRLLGRFQDDTYILLQQFSTRDGEGRAVGRRRPLFLGHDQWPVMMSLAKRRPRRTPGSTRPPPLIVERTRR